MKYLTIDEFIKEQTEEDIWKMIDEYGEDYEVWIGNMNNFSSSPITSVWALNKTDNGCDIIVEASL